MTRTKKKAPQIRFETVAERVAELEGLTLKEITDRLGYRETGTAKAAFYHWQRTKRLRFAVSKGVYHGFEVLDKTVLNKWEDEETAEQLNKVFITLNAERIAVGRRVTTNDGNKPKDVIEGLKRIETAETTIKRILGQNSNLASYTLEVLASYGITALENEDTKKD